MKRKLYKGLGMLVMAGFLVTAVGSNVHATETQFNENTENSSQQNENKSKDADKDSTDDKSKDVDKDSTDDKSGDTDKDSTDDTEQIEEGKAAASEDGSDSENKDKDDSDKDTDGETDESGEVPESEETVASTEDLEETTAEETLAETEALIEETVPAETTAPAETLAEKKKEYLTMEDMEGLWSIDDITSYRFTKSGTGALVLPEHSYSFDYELEEDTLKVDFEKSNLRDSTFKVSIVDGVMNLQCLDEYFENEYELQKAED